ncbi:MAG: sugar phosphate isomerase/epimerase [Oscillospiraceae bacterium]|nr:sugar phosphate isomerase/epimerase [Oscillospiraceae bacterium]
MKIGICGGADKAALAKSAGCDYLEMHFTHTAQLDDETFAETREELARVGIPCEAMNCFLPADFQLASPELDVSALQTFLAKGFMRAEQLGVQVVVFGAGRARRLPDGMPKQTGWQILAPICRLAGDLAAKHGITIAIEPLNVRECNVVNTLRDGLALMKLADHPNVRLLADMYHISDNGEDTRDLLLAGTNLLHCHAASPGRKFPMPGDGHDYTPFFAALHEIGYTGRVSIEAAAPNSPEEDLATCVALLRDAA